MLLAACGRSVQPALPHEPDRFGGHRMPEIFFQAVSKSYGKEGALHDVTVAFADDVITAVVGPSGSGKSTLLHLINGLVRPNSGTVQVFGKPIYYDRLPQLRRQIGYAVQGTGL